MPLTRPVSHTGALLAGLLTVVTLAYLSALDGAFQFDDYNVIVNQNAVHTWDAWVGSMPGIRPLLKLSYWFNWSLGHEPRGFHLVNLVSHLGCAMLVFYLCRRLVSETGTAENGAVISLTAALIFALHPAQTEVVTYISGRSTGLMSLFYLGALMAHVKAEDGKARRRWAGLSLLLFVAAMAVKETALTLPFALLLWEQARGRQPFRQSLRRLWPHFAVLAALAVAVLLHSRYRHLLAVSLGTRSPLENLAVQVHGVFYLIANPLLLLRTQSDPVVATDWPWYVTLAKATLLVVLLGVGFWQWRARPWLGFGLLWFFLHLLPTNSLVARLDVANDRQLYLPLMGLALIAAVLVHRLRSRRLALVVILSMVITLGAATALRNRDYRDEIIFWEAATEASPGKARAWNNLGYAYQQAGRQEEARKTYQRALEVDPAHWRARVNLMVLDEDGGEQGGSGTEGEGR